MTVSIRQATIDDADELARLRWDFSLAQAHSGLQSTDGFRDGFRHFVDSALSSGRWLIWVADIEGRIVSNIYVERIDKVPRPGQFTNQYGYITNVYTEPEFRSQGIGTRLLEAAIGWARLEGLEFLIVWPSEESITFYKRAGFIRTPEAMELHL